MRTLARIATAAVFAAVASATTLPLGCSDAASTTGKRIALDVTIAATPASRHFTNAVGWTVDMTRAELATGAFYFFDGETLFAQLSPHGAPTPRRGRWASFGLPFVREAHAHPGHYVPGNAKGELLVPSSADLLAGASLGRGSGVTGLVRSATFGYGSPASGPLAVSLGANVVVLEGKATKGTEVRVFRAEVAGDAIKDTKGLLQIEGCHFAETNMESDGVVAIQVDLAEWFDQVDFASVAASSDGSAVLLGAGVPYNQLTRGMKSGLGYTFAYTAR